ncbi:MAG: hypothetical protein ACE5PV_20865 [Candidatus Poribacteria bacterium]
MNQIRIIFWVLFFLLLPTFTFAQQATKADIQALELKMITTITEMDKRLTKQIADIDKRLTRLDIKVEEMDKRLTARIDLLFWAIGALVAVVLAVIALPQLLGYLQEKRARTDFQKRIDEKASKCEFRPTIFTDIGGRYVCKIKNCYDCWQRQSRERFPRASRGLFTAC